MECSNDKVDINSMTLEELVMWLKDNESEEGLI